MASYLFQYSCKNIKQGYQNYFKLWKYAFNVWISLIRLAVWENIFKIISQFFLIDDRIIEQQAPTRRKTVLKCSLESVRFCIIYTLGEIRLKLRPMMLFMVLSTFHLLWVIGCKETSFSLTPKYLCRIAKIFTISLLPEYQRQKQTFHGAISCISFCMS